MCNKLNNQQTNTILIIYTAKIISHISIYLLFYFINQIFITSNIFSKLITYVIKMGLKIWHFRKIIQMFCLTLYKNKIFLSIVFNGRFCIPRNYKQKWWELGKYLSSKHFIDFNK